MSYAMSIAIGVCLFSVAPACVAGQSSWTVSERPTLVIGSLDGPASEQFHDIGGVVRAPDDKIVVADGGSRELRVFSAKGAFLRAFGQLGDGPREFRSIAWVDVCGGTSVVAYDYARARITKWNTQGDLMDEFGMGGIEPGRPPYSVDCGPDGSFVIVGWPHQFAAEVGPYRPDVRIATAGPTGAKGRILGSFPGSERYRYPTNDGPRRLGKKTVARMASGVVYIATGDSLIVQAVAPDGGARAIGMPRAPVQLTRRLEEQWRESIVSRTPPVRRAAARRALRELVLPTHLPAYSDVRVDRLGLLWVAPYYMPGEQTPDRVAWGVFTPDGLSIGSVLVPANFVPTDIGRDYLLGVSTDALDVQRVHRYGLIR